MNLADDQFRLLVESVQDYAIYLLDPSGLVRSWNAGAERLKGYTAEEAIGRSLATFFIPDDRASGKPQQLLAAALKFGRYEDSGWRVRKDGSQFWANAVITALFEDGRAAPAPLSPTALGGIRIVLVDDDEDTRQAIADALASVGASVEQAVSASDAVQRLQLNRPDVLLSDIGMPLEDGYALIRRVRSLAPDLGGDVPAIALTAYARHEDATKAEASGFQLHVSKPVALEDLIDAIRSCLPSRSGTAR
ncbi:MAG TPA: response regulator [Kofleriaceae bacterium]|nr:response regulator [Kofleriaceae bacterium]